MPITSPKQKCSRPGSKDGTDAKVSRLVRVKHPMNFVTAPLIADLFLLAILAIDEQEVHDGTVGADHNFSIDIMVFFLTLAYIAISIDASGLIRYLAFKVLQWGGNVGHRLFFYLYAFFFGLGTFIGNDPIILSGTAFLAYMTRVSRNILHPRAWIHTQFAIANTASAILVSSNPTNLVLAGAFNIKFIHYTANMIVSVVVTAIVLFPFLLYFVFADEDLIPTSITMEELPEEARQHKPVNPNIPFARGNAAEEDNDPQNAEGQRLSLEEIMNPFLDKASAAFGALLMATTLITLLALNASTPSSGEHQVFWVTLPAAFVMFCWDIAVGWRNRKETRETAKDGRAEVERARAERVQEEGGANAAQASAERTSTEGLSAADEQETTLGGTPVTATKGSVLRLATRNVSHKQEECASSAITLVVSRDGDQPDEISQPAIDESISTLVPAVKHTETGFSSNSAVSTLDEKRETIPVDSSDSPQAQSDMSSIAADDKKKHSSHKTALPERETLVSLVGKLYRWSQETFPTTMAVLGHLPFALVPFALAMFVLVQALVSKGWVDVFAYGWDHWVDKTGVVGAMRGMGFLSVVLAT